MFCGRGIRTLTGMVTTAPALPQFNVLQLLELEDPYATYRDWREAGPLMDGLVGWGVTRHAEVSALMKDPRMSHAFPVELLQFALGDGSMCDFQYNSVLNREGADHSRLRRLMHRAFTLPLVRKLRDHITELVDGLLDPMLDGEARDIVTDVAFPLPTAVICELLNISDADRDAVAVQAAGFGNPDTGDATIDWLRGYIGDVLADRVADPDGDLLQRMLAAEEGEDRFSHAEIVDNAVLLFFGGFETTKHLITSGTAALLQFPDQQRLLWNQPELARSAVEEFLRFDTPVVNSPRLTTAPIEVGGRVIKEGRFVQLLLACANHDERAFARPDQLDITRDPNPHVSFGGGPHYCLGAMLARLEAEVVFARLAQRSVSIEAAGEPTRLVRGFGTYSSVPIQLTV